MDTFMDRASQLEHAFFAGDDDAKPPIFEQDGMVLVDPEGRHWPIAPALAQIVQFAAGPDREVGGNILVTPVRYHGRAFNVRVAYDEKHWT